MFHNGNEICILRDSHWKWSFYSVNHNDVMENIFYSIYLIIYPKLWLTDTRLKFGIQTAQFLERTGTTSAGPVFISRFALLYWYFCNYRPYFLWKVAIIYIFFRFLLPDIKFCQGINFVFVAIKVIDFILSLGHCQVICTLYNITNCVVNAARRNGYHGHTCRMLHSCCMVWFQARHKK